MTINDSDAEMSEAQAQSVFKRLTERYRASALWFLKRSLSPRITAPLAGTILENIAQHADRQSWLQIRMLKRWRSRNFK